MMKRKEWAIALEKAGIEPSESILDEIEGIVAQYEHDEIRDPSILSKDRQSLRRLEKRLDKLKIDINRLTSVARDAFEVEYRARYVAHRVQDDLDALERFREVLDNILTRLGECSKVGRNVDARLKILFCQFANLFEKHSAEEFSYHDMRQGGRGSGFVIKAVSLTGLKLNSDQFDYRLRELDKTMRDEREK